MLFQDFIKKYKGKGTDYDNYAGVQCVDLAKLYIDKVIGAKPEAIGNAHFYYEDYEKTYLKEYFERVPYSNKPPKRGDLVVWGKKYNGTSRYGHIAIATGKADGSHLYTYDQNWGKTAELKKMREVEHTYTGILGYLRPKNQKNVVFVPSFKSGVYTLTAPRGLYKGWGTSTGTVKVKDLTKDGKAHATKKKGRAVLKKDTKVTIEKTKRLSSGNVWAKIPSGYMCIWHWSDEKAFIK